MASVCTFSVLVASCASPCVYEILAVARMPPRKRPMRRVFMSGVVNTSLTNPVTTTVPTTASECAMIEVSAHVHSRSAVASVELTKNVMSASKIVIDVSTRDSKTHAN